MVYIFAATNFHWFLFLLIKLYSNPSFNCELWLVKFNTRTLLCWGNCCNSIKPLSFLFLVLKDTIRDSLRRFIMGLVMMLQKIFSRIVMCIARGHRFMTSTKKMTNFMTLQLLHQQKSTIDLLFQNNRIYKHVTNFKAPPPNSSVWTSLIYGP